MNAITFFLEISSDWNSYSIDLLGLFFSII
jgi:hypothetical protein